MVLAKPMTSLCLLRRAVVEPVAQKREPSERMSQRSLFISALHLAT